VPLDHHLSITRGINPCSSYSQKKGENYKTSKRFQERALRGHAPRQGGWEDGAEKHRGPWDGKTELSKRGEKGIWRRIGSNSRSFVTLALLRELLKIDE